MAGSWLTSSVATGRIAVGIGNNLWAGDHNVAFGILMYLPDSTLTADGEPLIVRGVLALPPDVK